MLHRIDLQPFSRGVTRVGDDRIPIVKAAAHLDAVAVVAANLDLLEMHGVIRADQGNGGAIRREQSALHWG